MNFVRFYRTFLLIPFDILVITNSLTKIESKLWANFRSNWHNLLDHSFLSQALLLLSSENELQIAFVAQNWVWVNGIIEIGRGLCSLSAFYQKDHASVNNNSLIAFHPQMFLPMSHTHGPEQPIVIDMLFEIVFIQNRNAWNVYIWYYSAVKCILEVVNWIGEVYRWVTFATHIAHIAVKWNVYHIFFFRYVCNNISIFGSVILLVCWRLNATVDVVVVVVASTTIVKMHKA